jgi:hypothetical protein
VRLGSYIPIASVGIPIRRSGRVPGCEASGNGHSPRLPLPRPESPSPGRHSLHGPPPPAESSGLITSDTHQPAHAPCPGHAGSPGGQAPARLGGAGYRGPGSHARVPPAAIVMSPCTDHEAPATDHQAQPTAGRPLPPAGSVDFPVGSVRLLAPRTTARGPPCVRAHRNTGVCNAPR